MEKKKCRESSVPTMVKQNLSDDIIESNIMTRIPVKTLIRFMAVCKSWYSLFSNPIFMNSYYQIQKNKIHNLLLEDDFFGHRILVADSSLSLQYTPTTEPIFFRKLVKVVGCCVGLVCVFDYWSRDSKYCIRLWNPALSITKIVDTSMVGSGFEVCVGFGYDMRSKDHNVIRFYNDFFRIHKLEVYSLNSDSWRKIELDVNQFINESNSVDQIGVYVSSRIDGAYCWIARKVDHINGGFHDDRIIAFHMEDEAFKEMPLPHPSGNTLFIYMGSLAVLHTQDSLSRDILFGYSKLCYIWVMKEYGDPESWTMLCKFDSEFPDVSFVGVLETELMLLRWRNFDFGFTDIDEEVITINIGRLQNNTTISVKYTVFLLKAIWFSSFTESLALLNGVHSCTN